MDRFEIAMHFLSGCHNLASPELHNDERKLIIKTGFDLAEMILNEEQRRISLDESENTTAAMREMVVSEGDRLHMQDLTLNRIEAPDTANTDELTGQDEAYINQVMAASNPNALPPPPGVQDGDASDLPF